MHTKRKVWKPKNKLIWLTVALEVVSMLLATRLMYTEFIGVGIVFYLLGGLYLAVFAQANVDWFIHKIIKHCHL